MTVLIGPHPQSHLAAQCLAVFNGLIIARNILLNILFSFVFLLTLGAWLLDLRQNSGSLARWAAMDICFAVFFGVLLHASLVPGSFFIAGLFLIGSGCWYGWTLSAAAQTMVLSHYGWPQGKLGGVVWLVIMVAAWDLVSRHWAGELSGVEAGRPDPHGFVFGRWAFAVDLWLNSDGLFVGIL